MSLLIKRVMQRVIGVGLGVGAGMMVFVPMREKMLDEHLKFQIKMEQFMVCFAQFVVFCCYFCC